MRSSKLLAISLSILAVSSAAQAQSGGGTAAGSSVSKWGVRVGVASKPDQILGGVHFLETEIAKNVYLEPNVELGLGDDVTVITGTAPFFYRFQVDAKVRPYAGGGVTLGYIDSDFEIALRIAGGIQWRLSSGTEMFAELDLGSDDLHDVQAVVGWRF